MTFAFLMQLILSVTFIAVMVGVTALARIPRPAPALDEALLRRLLADDYPDTAPGDVWLSTDGAAGLARHGDLALIAWRLGDSYVTRDLAWDMLSKARREGRQVIVGFAGPAGGAACFDWPVDAAWPPATLAHAP